MRLAAAIVIGVTLLAGPAWAGEQVELRMEGWWGGLKAADVVFTVDGANAGPAASWDGQLAIRTAGMMKWITGLVAELHGHGHFVSPGAVSESYLQHIRSKKSDRTVTVGFAGDPPLGARLKDIETFSDPSKAARDAENVPDLPEDQRRGAIDPIGAILSLGHRALAGETRFVLPVYDGRRRFDLAVEVKGPGSHRFDGKQVASIDAIATLHVVGGFKPFHAKWWNNSKFELILDPATGLPRQISSSSFVAAVVLTAHAICPPDPDCAFPQDH